MTLTYGDTNPKAVNREKPIFHIYIGLPGSNRDKVAEQDYKENAHDSVLISSEHIRKQFGWPHDPKYTPKVREVMEKAARTALKDGKDVFFDATNFSRSYRSGLAQSVKPFCEELRCHLVMVPVNECKKNYTGPDEDVDSLFLTLLKSYNPPAYTEGWNQIYIETAGYDYARFINSADSDKEVLGFSLLDLDVSQDNTHHELTLLQHMKEAESIFNRDYIEELPTTDNPYLDNYYAKTINGTHKLSEVSRSLWYDVKEMIGLHDIGKFCTKSFCDDKGNPTKEAHYYGHENYGAYLYLIKKIMDTAKEMSESECSRFHYPAYINAWVGNNAHTYVFLSHLLSLHMRPFTAWDLSSKAKNKDARRFGEDIIKDLEAIHKCDVLAHSSPEMPEM